MGWYSRYSDRRLARVLASRYRKVGPSADWVNDCYVLRTGEGDSGVGDGVGAVVLFETDNGGWQVLQVIGEDSQGNRECEQLSGAERASDALREAGF
jgi:hypothetical protein